MVFNHKKYMSLALDLARRGLGAVAPNPMVGAVIVSGEGEIIGSGYHQMFGEAHAEVNAINSCSDKDALRDSTMYVTLEPCSHYGKTPPCADLIIATGIPRVVVAMVDPFEKVDGSGIAALRDAGVDVIVGVMQAQAQQLNARFFTYVEQHRPYIILKWAQSADNAMDIVRTADTSPAWMTGNQCRTLVHTWRAAEDAIIIGRQTAELDNPSLTVRNVAGNNPIRIVVDKNLSLPKSLAIFTDDAAKTIVFANENGGFENENVIVVKIDFSTDILPQILAHLYSLKIQSLIVEGGAMLLNSFIEAKMWDEARIFTTPHQIAHHYPSNPNAQSVKAPKISGKIVGQQLFDNVDLTTLERAN